MTNDDFKFISLKIFLNLSREEFNFDFYVLSANKRYLANQKHLKRCENCEGWNGKHIKNSFWVIFSFVLQCNSFEFYFFSRSRLRNKWNESAMLCCEMWCYVILFCLFSLTSHWTLNSEWDGDEEGKGWCTHKLNVWSDNEIPIKFHQLKLY